MKGTLKSVHANTYSSNRTNFNDWSDPKSKPVKKVAEPLVATNIEEGKLEVVEKHRKLSTISETSIQIEQLRQKIKEGYPLLSKKEIRNIKLPFYESLLINLHEDGFVATSQFISDLIDMDEQWHKQREINPIIKNRIFLKSNTLALKALCLGLTEAELAKLENNKTQELKSLINTAIYFSQPEDHSQHWLAVELYEQCNELADESSEVLDQELKAIAKHIYAKFLLDVLNEPEQAKSLVEDSMKLSVGKSWNAQKVTGHDGDILYFESCLLLHKIFLVMSQRNEGYDVEKAIQLCRSSLHWAKEIANKNAEGVALLNLVHIKLKAGQLPPVLGYLDYYMSICEELGDVLGLCEGYILKSDYHKLIDDDAAVISDIYELLKIAEKHNVLKMIAIAHRKLAIFYSMQRKPKEMLCHAVKAYKYSVTLKEKSDLEKAMCLTGIAHAQEIMCQYISILLDAEDTDCIEFKILMLWKALHIPFFSDVKLFHPEAQVNEELKDKLENLKNEEINTAYAIRRNENLMSMSRMSFSVLHSFPSETVTRDKLNESGFGGARNRMNSQRLTLRDINDTDSLAHMLTRVSLQE